MKIVLSNGFCKFHLAVLGAELASRGNLRAFLTGAYPTPTVRRLLRNVSPAGRLQRLLQRGEAIPDELVRPFWQPEVLYNLRVPLRRVRSLKNQSRLVNASSFRRYGSRACNVLPSYRDAEIYHYRAGMGGVSVQRAKELGMIALCDHSIAHPSVLEYLVEHGGSMPSGSVVTPRDPVEQVILADIEAADHVLVNSDFVKETMVAAGYPVDKVTVVYLGVDDQFLEAVAPEQDRGDVPLLMFAGGYETRKGAPVLEEALLAIDDVPWRLGVASGVRAGMTPLLSDPRVMVYGFLSRRELAHRMSASDIFVFPSLAEGSARVIFEALASGCYVITTPNSGSIVQDGVHGAIVPPDDAGALEAAVRAALTNIERCREIGRKNAVEVRTRYRQVHYADQVLDLYKRLLSDRARP